MYCRSTGIIYRAGTEDAVVFIFVLSDLHGMADAAYLEAASWLQILHFQPDSPPGQPVQSKITATQLLIEKGIQKTEMEF
jgi:hypothetical protein